MVGLEFSIVGSHQSHGLGNTKTVKTTIELFRTWSLFFFIPIIGCYGIRPKILYRAACIIALQSLIIFPLLYTAAKLKLPTLLFVSPIPDIIGMNASAQFKVFLYNLDFLSLRHGLLRQG